MAKMKGVHPLKLALAGLLITAVIAGVAGVLLVGANYRPPDGAEGLIYPGVSVAGVPIAGLTRNRAAAVVAAALPHPEETELAIEAGDQSWQLTWAAAGQGHDVSAAVETAYAAGAARPWWLGAFYHLRPLNVDVPVPQIPADPDRVRGFVAAIADAVAVAPQDAALIIAGDEVSSTPAQEGRYLEVETATQQVLAALKASAQQVSLATTPIAPRYTSPEPALSQARFLAQQTLTVVVHDPVILPGDAAAEWEATPGVITPPPPGYHAEFATDSSQILRWLRIRKKAPGLELGFDVMGIRDWVDSLAGQIDPLRILDVDATTVRVAQTLRAGGGLRINAVIHHTPITYTVDYGDTFFDIAFYHGFPQWHLERANPDVEPGLIDVGQKLVIPSIDTLMPHPLVEGKRIDIDLPTQTLRAWDEDTLAFELRISSGMSKTPTIQGQFQILFKEESAFAQRWHLDMPYFMGFYEEGEGYFNGIHELPITSYGTRLSAGVLGYPASYGCIIVAEGAAKELFAWADIGTLVAVHGVAPGTPFGRETLEDIAPLIEPPEP